MEIISLLLLPLIALWIMRFSPINQANFLDPYIYTGYIHDFHGLIARYGLTYYSVRFGMIVPAQAFDHLFGSIGGYLVFRYVLALIAGVPLYYVVKRHFSIPVAILTVVGMLMSPYFARALLWDYPDAAGVPYLIAAISLFLLEDRPSLWRDTLAGASAAMAVNSNFFEVALVGIFGAVWLFFSVLFRRPVKDLTKRIVAVALGGMVICFLGCVYYWHALGKPTNIFYPTYQMARTQASGGAGRWRTQGASWIAGQIQVLMPVFLSLFCLLVSRWRRVSFTSWVVVSFGFATTAFYYVEQFLLGSNVLEFFYYFSYLIPAVFLMLAYLWENLWVRARWPAPVFVAVGLEALLMQWALGRMGWHLPGLTVSQWLALGGVTAAVLFFSARESYSPLLQATLSWLGLLLLGGFFSAGLANYTAMMPSAASGKKVEMEVYRVALQFMDAVPKLAERPGRVMFWYNNRVGNAINSIQSTYLWGNTKINASSPEDAGLPHVGELQMRLLNDPQVRYLALLCESEAELSQGLAALRQQAIDFQTEDYHVLASGDYRIYFQLVELMHGSR